MLTFSLSALGYTKHSHYESSYQHAWCSFNKGIEEYENKDFTRVDCYLPQLLKKNLYVF